MNSTPGDPYVDLAAPRLSGKRARGSGLAVLALALAALIVAAAVGVLVPPRALDRLDAALTPTTRSERDASR